MTHPLSKNISFLQGFFTSRNMVKSIKAMGIAKAEHIHQRRDNVHEFTHQLAIANFLITSLEHRIVDEDFDAVIASALLHDTIEDYGVANHVVESIGEDVLQYVLNVTKKEGFSKQSAEDYDEYYAVICKCPFSIMIKGADRQHNLMSCLGGMSDKRIREYIEETEKYIIPMLKKARREFPEFYFEFELRKTTLKQLITMLEYALAKGQKDTKKA